ncbi:uncharacterized protein LOC131651873 [Vicia villosa]|uniref:uncharacterized protein LOC131651873 n=1 Tax=Vicia villosa TaxID=3911 RepID=UPI00273B344C|nr:uncharacterized protein LOC131651873 [Vicia villosa]
MVGFSSDTDEDSTIEEIISQAQDSILLKQISAINCSSFTHSDLPADLESRFHKLKSFPANHTTPPPYHPKPPPTFSNPNSTNPPKSSNLSPPKDAKSIKNPDSDSGSVSSPEKKENKPKPKPKNGSFSPSDSSHTSEESSMSSLFMPLQTKKDEEKRPKVKYVSPSPSPPRKWGCFWCSPKKEKKKVKSKENDDTVGSLEEYTSDEFLSDIGSLSSLSTKKRMNMIDKALKEEQEKINREAEKIVELVKQASARMIVSSDIEDELSDD